MISAKFNDVKYGKVTISRYVVYVMRDDDGRPAYVGKTTDAQDRMRRHLAGAQNDTGAGDLLEICPNPIVEFYDFLDVESMVSQIKNAISWPDVGEDGTPEDWEDWLSEAEKLLCYYHFMPYCNRRLTYRHDMQAAKVMIVNGVFPDEFRVSVLHRGLLRFGVSATRYWEEMTVELDKLGLDKSDLPRVLEDWNDSIADVPAQ